jgi:hypothetical protein
MKRTNGLLPAVMAALFCVCFAKGAAAFNVNPMTIELTATPGQSYTGSFEVVNSMGGAAEPARIYMEDWDKTATGEFVSRMMGTTERSCSSWLTLSPTQFDVPFHGAIDVKYTFSVPESATGSYWTFIMVEGVQKPTMPPSDRDGVQVFIGAKVRYGVRFVINVASGRQYQGKITEISIAPPTATDPKSPKAGLIAKVAFSNTGNTYVKPLGFFEIRNLDGDAVLRKDIAQFYVFPGRDRLLTVQIEKTLPPGEYIAVAVLDYGGESLVAGESHFTIPANPESAGGK